MFTTRALRQAAAHAERTPLIRFIGPRTIPGKLANAAPSPSYVAFTDQTKTASVDHTPKPHPASPLGELPSNFSAYGNGDNSSRHASFSSYRDHAQQHGPLQKSIRYSAGGIGGSAGSQLGDVNPPQGVFFDTSELPARFRRAPIDLAEIEAVESGGAAVWG
jgi:small subunit ribosomal protein YMR-31